MILSRYSFNKKFTLIELLVVIAIIGILVALLLPVAGGRAAQAGEPSPGPDIDPIWLYFDSLPAGTAYLSSGGGLSSTYLISSHQIVWDLGTVPPGQIDQLSALVLPVEQAGSGLLKLPLLITAPPEINLRTGSLAGVSPGSTAASAHSSPQERIFWFMEWRTASFRPLASHR